MENDKNYVCADCAVRLKELGFKVSETEYWLIQKAECAVCGNTNYIWGSLDQITLEDFLNGGVSI